MINFLKITTSLLLVFSIVTLMPHTENKKRVEAAVGNYGRTADGVWAYKVLNATQKTISVRPSDLKKVTQKRIVIPSKIEIQDTEYTVTEIAPYAYESCFCTDCLKNKKMNLSTAWEDKNDDYESENVDVDLDELVIPNTVTTIGNGAFENAWIGKVTFASGSKLTTIGEDAFSSMNMEQISIPASVTTIGDYAFSYGTLKKITFEEGSQLNQIADGTFAECELEQIKLPSGITRIREEAFLACKLKSIEIPASVTNIGISAFLGNKNLKEVTFASNGQLNRIQIGAFMQCNLKEVTIPSTVQIIGKCAFGNNENLSTVTFEGKSFESKWNVNAFAKVTGFDYEEDDVEDAKCKANTSVTKVNVENYDVYQGVSNKDMFSSSAKVYCAKTRVFLNKKTTANASGDVSMDSSKQAKISLEDFISLKAGDHFEGGSYQYAETLNQDKTETKEISGDSFVSKGYPFVIIKADPKKNYYIMNWIGENTISGIASHSGKMAEMTKSYYDLKNKKYYMYFDEEYVLPSYWEQGSYKKTGYHVSGYTFTTEDDKHHTYPAGDKVSKLSTNHKEKIDVNYAYEANKYKIVYDANATDAQKAFVTNTKCEYDRQVTISVEKPTRMGYEFKGWCKNISGDGRVYQSGELVNENFTSEEGASVTLYAVWDLITVEIRLDANGGSSSEDKIDVGYGTRLSEVLPKPTREGYEFLGWSMESEGEVLADNYKLNKEENFTLYAQWREITKKITIHFSTPNKISDDSAYEVVVSKNGQVIQNHDLLSSDVGNEKIIITGAKIGENYVITCTNYEKNNGQKKYYRTVTKEVTISE